MVLPEKVDFQDFQGQVVSLVLVVLLVLVDFRESRGKVE